MRSGPLTLGVMVVVSAGALWLAAGWEQQAIGPALRLALPLVLLAQLVVVVLVWRATPARGARGDARAEGVTERASPTAATHAARTPAAGGGDANAAGVPAPEGPHGQGATATGGGSSAAPASRSAVSAAAAGSTACATFEPDVLLATQRRTLLDLQVARLAHEANNQLLGLRFKLTELAGDAGLDATARAALPDLERAGEQLEQLVARMQSLGRGEPDEARPAELRATLEGALSMARGRPDVRGCRIDARLSEADAWVERPALLVQAVVGLLLNAAEAATSEGCVTLSATVEGGRARVRVDDDGPGIAPEDHARLVQPFTTTREGHCGLGLWAARRCAEELGGALSLGVGELGGLCVTLELSVRVDVPGTSAAARATPAQAPEVGGVVG